MVKTIQESNLMNHSKKLGFPANANFSEQMQNLAKVLVGNAKMRNFAKNTETSLRFFLRTNAKNAKFWKTIFFAKRFSHLAGNPDPRSPIYLLNPYKSAIKDLNRFRYRVIQKRMRFLSRLFKYNNNVEG